MKTQLTLLALALAAAASSASAATATGNINVSMTVSAICELDTSTANINHTFTSAPSQMGQGYIRVRCSDGLAYDVEFSNVAAGGELTLTSAALDAYPIRLGQGANLGFFGTPWGSKANGEEFNATGNGAWSDLYFHYEVLNAGNAPAPGTYSGVINVVVNY